MFEQRAGERAQANDAGIEDGADARFAGEVSGELLRVRRELGCRRQRRPGSRQQRFARLGEPYPGRTALEETQAERFLQRLDLAADRRLGDVQQRRRLGQVTLLGDGDEGAQ